MGLVSMVYAHSRQSIGIISPLFSGYTISLPGRVFGEQRGNAAEILFRIGVEHRKFRHRVEYNIVFYIILLVDMIEYG